MKYKIIEATQNEDTINTKVEFDFDGVLSVLNVPHFRPQSVNDVASGIENRSMSEFAKLVAVNACKDIVGQIEINKEIIV